MPDSGFPTTLKFHYIKGNFFRVIHVDGAVGGLTPSREIFVSLFNQRAALPQVIELMISPEGQLGKEVNRVGKEGIVREMEAGVVMSAKAAEELAHFLLEQVKLLRESTPEEREGSSTLQKGTEKK